MQLLLNTTSPTFAAALRQIPPLFGEGFTWGAVLRIVLIILATYFLVNLFSFLLKRFAQRSQRRGDVIQKIIPFVGYALWLIAILLILAGLFREPSVPVALMLGFLLIALLFSTHSILRDLVAGVIILFERPFRIGNTIRIGEAEGVVQRIGLRSFQLLSSDGVVVVLPNSEAIRYSVEVANSEAPEVMISIDLQMPSDIALERAKQIVREAAAVSPFICIRRPIEVILLENQLGKTAQHVQVKAFVFDARYASELKSDIVEACQKAFKLSDQTEQQELENS